MLPTSPHSTVPTDLWPAFLMGGWGGETEHRKGTLKSCHIHNWVYPVEKILSRRSAERRLGKFWEDQIKWREQAEETTPGASLWGHGLSPCKRGLWLLATKHQP